MSSNVSASSSPPKRPITATTTVTGGSLGDGGRADPSKTINTTTTSLSQSKNNNGLAVPSQLTVSVHVCDQCRTCLLQAFHHCLGGGGGGSNGGAIHQIQQMNPNRAAAITSDPSVLPSVRQLVEEAIDQSNAAPPPEFEFIDDPTRHQEPEKLFVSDTERQLRERVIAQELADLKLRQLQRNRTSDGGIISGAAIVRHRRSSSRQTSTSHGGPGAASPSPPPPRLPANGREDNNNHNENDDNEEEEEVHLRARLRNSNNNAHFRLKQHTQAQQREIVRLRAELLEIKEAEGKEKLMVSRLQHALQKSLDYCMRAKDWQEKESRSMRTVIEELKSEIGALMAFVISGEREKHDVVQKIGTVQEEKAAAEQKCLDLERVIEDLRFKMHHAFKDYLSVNQKLDKVTSAAAQEHEAIHRQNATLKQTMARLNMDLAVTLQTKQQAEADLKTLKFELEQMVYQFNKLGEEKLEADRKVEVGRRTIDRWEEDFTKLSEEFTQLTDAKRKLEDQFYEAKRNAAETKTDLEQKIVIISHNFELLQKEKQGKQEEIDVLQAAKADLTHKFKELVEYRTSADEKRMKSDATFRKDIQTRDVTIQELRAELTTARARAAKASEDKEHLLFEVTEVKNALEREVQNFNTLTEDFSAHKARSKDTIDTLEDKVQQLELIKANLNAEKKTLSDMARAVRVQLKQKEEEMAEMEKQKNASIHQLQDNLLAMTKKWEEEVLANKVLSLKNQGLERDLRAANDKIQQLTQSVHDMGLKVAALQVELKLTQDKLADMENQRNQVEAKRKELWVEKEGLTEALTKSMVTNSELEKRIANMNRDHHETIRNKDLVILGLETDIQDLKEEMKRQAKDRRYLMRRLKEVMAKYRSQREALKAETELRHLLENKLEELRDQHTKEMTLRATYEGIKNRTDRKQVEQEVELFRQLKERDHKFKWIDEKLHAELEHLNGFYRDICVAMEKSTLVEGAQ